MSAVVKPELGAVFDLGARTKLRLTGADRVRFLNGQISNDVRKAAPTQSLHACVLTAKGKISADVFIRVDGESLLIDSDAEVREQLNARLERYIIADDVQITDVTDEFALFHLVGAESPTVNGPDAVSAAKRFGCAGFDVWTPATNRETARQEFSAMAPFCDSDCAEVFRIERAIPRWGFELTEEIIPTEANLEAAAIDYAKGCYIGQEVISRIKMSGQTNKRLCGFRPTGEATLSRGMRLRDETEQKEVGWITSVATSARLGGQIALGFAKRGYQTQGLSFAAVTAEGLSARAELVPLPFF